MLQAGRSRVRFQKSSLDFFVSPNPSSRTTTLEFIQPAREMSTRNIPGGARRPSRKANTSPPSVNRLSRKCGILDVSRSISGMALLFFFYYGSQYSQYEYCHMKNYSYITSKQRI
jgi:hypothetical protein